MIIASQKLTELVGYKQNSVVSKTILKKQAGTVTLFAFDKGEGLSEHTAPFEAIVYLLDGAAEVTISGRTFQVKQGEIITLPANEPHALKGLERFKMMLIMIKN